MELWEVVARETIRDLIARYNATGDRGRIAEMAELFAADGVLEVGDRTLVGREAIAEFLSSLVEPQSALEVGADAGGARPDATDRRRALVRHFTATTQVDVVDARTARARSYYEVLTADGFDHCGRYLDEFASVDGQWRFAHRRATTDVAIEGGWADRRRAQGITGRAVLEERR